MSGSNRTKILRISALYNTSLYNFFTLVRTNFILDAFKENNKRKRVELKVEQKWEIIEYRKKFPNLSQVQLIVHFNRKFETVISKQTMSDMLKRDYEKKLEKINSVEDYNTRIREGNEFLGIEFFPIIF